MQAALNLVASVARGGLDAAPATRGAGATGEAAGDLSCFALLAAAAMGEPAIPAGNGPATSPPACAPPDGLALQLVAGAPLKPADRPGAGEEFATAMAAWIAERPSPPAQDGAEAAAGAEGFATAIAAWLGKRPSPTVSEGDPPTEDTGSVSETAANSSDAAADPSLLQPPVPAGPEAPAPASPVFDPASAAAAAVAAAPAPAAPEVPVRAVAAAPPAPVQAIAAAGAGPREPLPDPVGISPAPPIVPPGGPGAVTPEEAAEAEAGAPRPAKHEGAGATKPGASAAWADEKAPPAPPAAPAAPADAAKRSGEPAPSPGTKPLAKADDGARVEASPPEKPARPSQEATSADTVRPAAHWPPAAPHGPVPHAPAAPPPHAAAYDHAVPVVQNVPVSAVAVEIGIKSLAGVNRFEIRLDPPELGRVEVRLEIDEAGAVQARLVVDRVETLALLQREARTLERAFEQAGLKPSEGGIDLTLRDPQADARGQQRGDERGHRGDPQRAVPPRAEADAAEAPAPKPLRTVWRLAGGVDRRV